ncbi:hypothetical protein BT96DRAFT_1010604 [Gymnopus androsaceus JB14]|uniref:Uncharacterized protein n=1 Tax=Gymnopus androsaceus JB14 TaxID=1447944 RepID=A0A6A4GAH9_9AGAR|nr:hypothetical protein BT96DRAFT_1010604 [Gymnopus androsaceus JB14]
MACLQDDQADKDAKTASNGNSVHDPALLWKDVDLDMEDVIQGRDNDPDGEFSDEEVFDALEHAGNHLGGLGVILSAGNTKILIYMS